MNSNTGLEIHGGSVVAAQHLPSRVSILVMDFVT